jgi:hypothetical protein
MGLKHHLLLPKWVLGSITLGALLIIGRCAWILQGSKRRSYVKYYCYLLLVNVFLK